MKIKAFSAKNVYGYLNFDIRFNDDVSFLTGGNGSGKTTALKLMNALITPNFKDLLHIPFDFASLTLEQNHERIEISAVHEDERKILRISTLNEVLSLPSLTDDESEDFIDDINRSFADDLVVRAISKLNSPVFLGLDRRRENSSGDFKYFAERERWLGGNVTSKRAMAVKRLFKGSLGLSLMETEFLVQEAYKRIRNLEARQSTRLRDSILISAFQYSDFNTGMLSEKIGDWRQNQELLQREREIKETLSKIDDRDSKLSNEVDKFFNQLKELFVDLSQKEEHEITVEWLLNKAQIDRMASIIEIIDEHKSKIDEFFRPISNFLDTVNSFYEESHKRLTINTVGQLTVNRPNGKTCTIEGLSSGERQLLVIFAHTFFSPKKNRRNIFIIDEPELSLHIRWQERFAETIFSVNPSFQFILATHSPDIIGYRKNRAVRCR
jgi:predicted ATP-binding protein involved in virulence